MSKTNPQYTVGGFAELLEAAAAELHEHSDVFEIHDLRTWRKKFFNQLGVTAEYAGAEFSEPSATEGE